METQAAADEWIVPSWRILNKWRAALRANSVSLPIQRMWRTWSMKEWNEYATMYPYDDIDAGLDMRPLPVRAVYIGSVDDPICPVTRLKASHHPDFFDKERALVVTTDRGGHCAWIDGFNTSTWLTNVFSEMMMYLSEDALYST